MEGREGAGGKMRGSRQKGRRPSDMSMLKAVTQAYMLNFTSAAELYELKL